MGACCLCSDINARGSAEIWNKPLFESPNFAVFPSLGSLVEGWLLVIPKAHFLCIGALPDDLTTELEALKQQISAAICAKYGHVCAFEHGPRSASRKVGCTVDHAHVHIVPVSFDLAKAASKFMPPDAVWIVATPESRRAAFLSRQDYLYLEQPIGSPRIALHDNFSSQIFRKAIASTLGVPEQFSWREYPQTEIILRTIRAMNSLEPQAQL